MKTLAIFGAGRFGKAAWEYYHEQHQILFFLDNDADKWNMTFCGIRVCNPDILKSSEYKNIRIVIANKLHWKEIQKQLAERYQITWSLVFGINEDIQNYNDCEERCEGRTIIKFMGGLGNQLFQYAFYKYLENEGNNVRADLSAYFLQDKREFLLNHVFPDIDVILCNSMEKKELEDRGRVIKDSHTKEVISAGTCQGFFLEGYWMNYIYSQSVKKELLFHLKFMKKKDSGLNKMKQMILNSNSVSVHIRRGDYMELENSGIYGNICTYTYYKKAVKYLESLMKDIVFYIFSDDILWVEDKVRFSNVVCIKKEMFTDYEDWYDMYLMSLCKHNIIANSSFSWWAAWLNNNAEKIVLYPQVWTKRDEYDGNICPSDWIGIR